MKPWLPGPEAGNRDRTPANVTVPALSESLLAGGHDAATAVDPKRTSFLPSGSQTAPVSQPVFVNSALSPTLSTSREEKPLTGVRAAITSTWLWRARGFWLGGIGTGLALYGQKVLTVDHNLTGSIRWYALGILVVLLAWLGTYKNKSLLVVPVRRVVNSTLTVRRRSAGSLAQKGLSAKWRQLVYRYPFVAGAWPRYLLAFAALGLNIYSAGLIRKDYYSAAGGFGWLASLVLLVLAFVHERRVPVRDLDAGIVEIEDRTDPRPSRLIEAIIVAGIFAVAIFMRFYRLGDWATGVHGDEGEAGVDALNILNGNHVSPFTTGWFAQPNFYYWGIAAGLKLFGTGLFGDRIFSTVMGTLMLVPFYPLVRMWFGVRTAIIATIFLAISDVTVHFTRIELSNITTPLSLVLGFYFFYRGMCNKRVLNFILSGFGFMFGLYFYNGGRLTPIMLAGVLVYLFLFMPLVRVPDTYRDLRKLRPGLSRLRVLRGAIRTQALHVLHYVPQVVIFLLACICFASPFLVYMFDHSQEVNARAGDKLIFNNEARMQDQYGVSHQVSHAPLYIGIRWPTENDIYPVVPIFFEQTPVSAKLQDDGFWTRVLWAQTTTTLSIMTYRFEACSFYTFTQEPIAKPIEAVLIILGLSWALWRWRDTRMAMLTLWFWSAIFAGGVLTIDAPYMCRIIGIVPTLAIFAALPLSKLSAEMIGAFGRVGRITVRRQTWQKVGRTISATAVVTLLVYLTLQNYSDYFLRYLATHPFSEVTGQAQFVHDMNDEVAAEGRPQPVYYDLGMHMIFWGHGVNRFLNNGTDGHDMANPANELPILDTTGRDAVFMVWNLNSHYMQAIKTYYPEGEEGDFAFPVGSGAGPLFRYYRVKREQIDARRVSLATYTPANGPAIERQEPGMGSAGTPPTGMTYPARAEWHGDIVAPAFGSYKFSLDTAGDGALLIDGTPVLTNTAQAAHSEGELLLARGPHDVRVAGTLAAATSQVALAWSSGGSAPSPIARQYLWSGPGRALLGVIRPYTGDLSSESPADPSTPTVVSERVDGFLGFRDSPSALGGSALDGTWTGTLTITQDGQYGFDVYSNGGSSVFIDDQLVLKNENGTGQPTQGSGQVQLTAGPHKYVLRYVWQGGTGYLEAFWTPPGGTRALLGSEALHTDGGIVDPGAVGRVPPPVDVNHADTDNVAAKIVKPNKVLSLSDAGVVKPRGLAVDKAGNVYLGDRGNHRIVVMSPDGKLLKTWGKAAPDAAAGQSLQLAPGDFGEITDIAILDDNTNSADLAKVTVYVLDTLGRVQAFTGNGDPVGAYEASQLGLFAGNGISASAASPTGPAHLYIAVTGQNRIARLPSIQTLLSSEQGKPDSSSVLSSLTENVIGAESGKLEQPVDVVADPTNPDILYSIDLKDRIAQFKRVAATSATPATSAPQGSWAIAKSWKVPVGRDDGGGRLGISPDGSHVYMSDPDHSRVAVLDVKTGEVSYFGAMGGDAGQFRSPTGLTVGADGQVYVLDRENVNVQVFAAGSK